MQYIMGWILRACGCWCCCCWGVMPLVVEQLPVQKRCSFHCKAHISVACDSCIAVLNHSFPGASRVSQSSQATDVLLPALFAAATTEDTRGLVGPNTTWKDLQYTKVRLLSQLFGLKPWYCSLPQAQSICHGSPSSGLLTPASRAAVAFGRRLMRSVSGSRWGKK